MEVGVEQGGTYGWRDGSVSATAREQWRLEDRWPTGTWCSQCRAEVRPGTRKKVDGRGMTSGSDAS